MGKKNKISESPTATGTTQSQAGYGILFTIGFWIITNLILKR